jgi:hypothetical protein
VATFDRYIALAKKYGMNMGAEERPLESYIMYIAKWQARTKVCPPAVLENHVCP